MYVNLSEIWYWLLLGAVCSYFLGCFNFAVLISKLKHKDIRSQGSGNPGTMNMSRTFGWKIGLINFLCDALKGIIPVMVGHLAFVGMYFALSAVPPSPAGAAVEEGVNVAVSDFARYLFGLCAVAGHVFPVTMKFKGGKGIATTLGVFTCGVTCEVGWFFPIAFAFLVFIVFYIYVFEWGSMGSLIGVSGFTIWQGVIFFLRYSAHLSNGYVIATFMLLLVFNLITWIAHHKNLYRLMGGEEHRTSIKKMVHKNKSKA